MDDRSRKLLSNQALPKAKLPEPKPHQRREFKLPQGVTPKPVMRATSEGLRAKALEEGVKLAEGSKGNVKLPGMPPVAPENISGIAALGEVKWPAIGTPPPPFADPAGAAPAASGKAIRRTPSASVPPPAPPIPPPVVKLTQKKAAAPAPAPVVARPAAKSAAKLPAAKLPAARVAVPAPVVPAPVATKKPVLVDYDAATPAPQLFAAGKGKQAALVVAEGAPSFREATSMWFRTGDDQAARAVRDAEADAMERAEEAFLAGRSNVKLYMLVAFLAAAIVAIALALK